MFRRSIGAMTLTFLSGVKFPAKWTKPDRDRYEKRVRNRTGGWAYPVAHCGAKECARRVRQIEAGSLRAQNGLTYEPRYYPGGVLPAVALRHQ